MTTLEFGTVGLRVAIRLFGMGCVVSNSVNGGTVEIPDGEVDALMELVMEAVQKERNG